MASFRGGGGADFWHAGICLHVIIIQQVSFVNFDLKVGKMGGDPSLVVIGWLRDFQASCIGVR